MTWQLQSGVLSRAALDAVAGIPLSIGGTPVTAGTVGVAYAGFTATAAGGTAPYAYSVASGTLPAGITLNSSSGAVSGTPTTAGSYTGIVIRATDAVTATADLASFTIAVAAASATWDTGTVTSVTLSGGNLVATNTGTTSANQGARVASASGKTSGKHYFEITLTTILGMANGASGIGTTASTYTNLGNSATTGVMCYWQGGNVWANGVNSGSSIGTRVAGNVVGIAIDLDNRRAWHRVAPSGNWNGSGTANPATNTGGVTIPAGTMAPVVTFGGASGVANNVVTANFGASAFTGTVPSGFTSGWQA